MDKQENLEKDNMASGAHFVSLIPIRDMNRAIKFYSKSMGATLSQRGTGQMRNYWAAMRVGDGEVWFVAPDKLEPRKLAYNLLQVKDIKRFVKKLQANGVKFQRATRMGPKTKVMGPIAFETFGASAFFKDSEGNLLMVWQYLQSM